MKHLIKMLRPLRRFSNWAQPAFGFSPTLKFPVLSFTTKQQVEEIELDPSVFNQPLRVDLVHNVFHYYRCLDWQTTHRVKRYNEISGSGKKMRPQKGTGQARLGFKRASRLRKGAKVHGPVPRDHSFSMNKKVVLQALKTILCARLCQGSITFVDSCLSGFQNTSQVNQVVKDYGKMLLVDKEFSSGFVLASRNIPSIELSNYKELSLKKLVKHTNIIITKEGLEALQSNIKASEDKLYKNRKLYRKTAEESKEEEPIEEVVVKSKPLKEIVEKYNLDVPTA